METSTHITINPARYLYKLHATLDKQVAELRNTLRSLEDGSFLKKARADRPGAIIQLRVEAPDNNVKSTAIVPAAPDACNRCFLSMVRMLITFLDHMIAMRRCIQQKINLTEPINSAGELELFIESMLENHYKEVSRDTRLKNPAKISEFNGLPEPIKRMAESYFALRRCLEHHNGMPAENIRVYARTPQIFAGDQEIRALPHLVNSALTIRFDISWDFPANTPISLTEAHIDSIYFTIRYILPPAIIGDIAALR